MPFSRNIEVLSKTANALVSHNLADQGKFGKNDIIRHGQTNFGDVYGLKAFMYEAVQAYFTAFPDLDGAIDIQVAQGDWIAETGYFTGMHMGKWLGISSTSIPVKVRYSDF